MRRPETMCPHPVGPASDLTVLGGQYGILRFHPEATHATGSAVDIWRQDVLFVMPVFSCSSAFQISCLSHFLRVN